LGPRRGVPPGNSSILIDFFKLAIFSKVVVSKVKQAFGLNLPFGAGRFKSLVSGFGAAPTLAGTPCSKD